MRLAEDYFVDAKRRDALKFYRFLSINKYSCYFGILIGFYGHIVGRLGRTIALVATSSIISFIGSKSSITTAASSFSW